MRCADDVLVLEPAAGATSVVVAVVGPEHDCLHTAVATAFALSPVVAGDGVHCQLTQLRLTCGYETCPASSVVVVVVG